MPYKKSVFAKMGTKKNIPANKGVSTIRDKYKNLHPLKRKKQVALDASNNGKCWWVYTWLMGNEKPPNSKE